MRGWEDQEEASDGCARPPGELANGRTVVPGGPLTLLDRLQLCRAAWAPGGPWDRDGAFTALWGRPPGSFLVLSDSASRPQLLCLSVGGNVQAVRDFPIRCTGEVFHLPESHLGFSDLVQLVAFYSLCRDVLPLCLFLPPCLYGITEEPGQNLSHLGPKFWLCPSPGQKLDDVSMRSMGITMCSIQVTSANGALCVVNPLYLHEHGDAWLRPTPSPQSGQTANHKRPQSGQTANQKRERRLSTTRPWGGAGLRSMRGPSLDHEPPDMRTDVPSKTAPSESPTVPPPASPSVPDRVVLRRASQPTGCESFRRQSQGAPAGEARRFSDGLGPQSPHRVSWIEEGVWLSPPPSVTHPPSLELDSLSVSSLEEEPEGGGSPAHQHHAHHRLTLVLADKMKNRLSAVGQAFGGLLSPQKRLQKRVQELSERRSGAFPEALRGFLELTLRGHARAHPTAADMLQEVRNALTGLREALFDCPEIQVLVDGMGDVSDWELDAMVEESLHKVALKPVSSHLYACLREFRSSDGTLQQLQENQKALETQDPKGLGGTAGAGVPDALTLEKIQQRWASMHQAYSPSKKVETLLKVCKIIYHSMSANASSGAVFGADDFLPCLTWVLLRCDVTTLQLDTDYMMELLDPTQLQGEGGYYLTSLYASLFYISSFQPRLATRQLSVEAQQSLSKWHRRRTLHCNQGRQSQNRRTIRRHAPGEGAGPQREAGPADGDVSQRGGAGTEPAREELAVLGEEEGCPEPPRTGSSAEAEEPGVCPPEGGQEGRGEQGSAREGRGLPETAGKHETEKSEKEEERFQERGFADCSWDRGTGSQGQAEVAQIPLDSSGECAR
ncbi:ras and Rab interactor 2 [Conger conger]|uniref:ras and Rab interactor 2 n=1 Tax=Conger conger TaxID=82655 RepID=UPI002A5A9043|nr:ras and Rab interactor 2 [Conger conger]XP_061074395.1 ras and Rab interactor 2 [Conger conger]XP_061074396.1 ras and Rab interactor 2 [Conger conger]XP_061074397.1 ras and Rab interactor 2 [Conger conger]XP_061074398.1 ras and Rab interactor 2 [Conger conger]